MMTWRNSTPAKSDIEMTSHSSEPSTLWSVDDSNSLSFLPRATCKMTTSKKWTEKQTGTAAFSSIMSLMGRRHLCSWGYPCLPLMTVGEENISKLLVERKLSCFGCETWSVPKFIRQNTSREAHAKHKKYSNNLVKSTRWMGALCEGKWLRVVKTYGVLFQRQKGLTKALSYVFTRAKSILNMPLSTS